MQYLPRCNRFNPHYCKQTTICKSVNMIHFINRSKYRNYMVISTDIENIFDKIPHPFRIKTLNKLEIEGIYFNIAKAKYDTPVAHIIFNSEKLIFCDQE